jgi:hypothetical protein
MKMMKKSPGLSDLAPRHYALGGSVQKSNDELVKPSFNPNATFSGSPRGTGLEAKGGQFTAASANAFRGAQTPRVTLPGSTTSVGEAVAPRTVTDARNNSLSAFLGGNIAPTTPTPDPIGGTPMPKPFETAATPVATMPFTPGPAASALPGQANTNPNTVSKSTPFTGGVFAVDDTPTTPAFQPMSAQKLDATNDRVKYGLPTGETVGYGGKLSFDAGRAARGQLGRDATEEELAMMRARLHGGVGLSDLEGELNMTAEGQEFNLAHDPLDDQQFVTRLFRSAYGRDPSAEDMTFWTNRLAQGQDRRGLAEYAAGQNGGTWTPEQIDDLIGQGDAFAPDLQGDEMETILRQQFTATMGREPTDYELAKYASGVRGNRWSLNPGENNITDALSRRRTEGWARGGRGRKWIGGPLDGPEGFADGGCVTTRDRFIDEQVNAAPTKEEVRESPREARVEQTSEEKALLEKYRRKSLAERMKAGLSSLLN